MIRTAFLRTRPCIAALLLACVSLASAQEAAIIKRATEMRDKPGGVGTPTPLDAQTLVTRLPDRQGAWVQVRTATGTTGWVHLFDLAPASGSAAAQPDAAGSGGLRGVTNLFSRSNTTTSTSASGIRGLGAEDLARATPNPAAVAQMEGLRVNEQDALAFARRAALRPVAVQPLPAPARTSGNVGDPANQRSP